MGENRAGGVMLCHFKTRVEGENVVQLCLVRMEAFIVDDCINGMLLFVAMWVIQMRFCSACIFLDIYYARVSLRYNIFSNCQLAL